MELRVTASITGDELAVIQLEPAWSLLQLKEAIQRACEVPVAQQRLLYEATVLPSTGQAEELLRGLGASGKVALELLRVASAADLPGQHLGRNCLCSPGAGEVCLSVAGSATQADMALIGGL